MAEPQTVLAYERQREPPYLIREPGRVALVMPPTPRWLGAFVVTTQAACCVALTFIAVMLVRKMWRGTVSPAAAEMRAILAYILGLPVLFITFLAFQVRWWLRTSRQPAVIEIRGGELAWTVPGFWSTKQRRVPLTRVRGVTVRGTPIGTSAVVRIRVDFVGWRPRLQRGFFTTDPMIAEEARKAFDAVTTDAARQTR
jgi:hypothetical protein